MKLELKEIRKQRQAWLDAVNSNNLQEIESILTDDAVWIPPGMPALESKKAIADWMKPSFDEFNHNMEIAEDELKGAGHWVVEHASFKSRLNPKDGGEGTVFDGKYIVIWRLEKDNKWRIERYLDNS